MTGLTFDGKVLALSGGVGGAKLVSGLACLLAPEQLIVVANTGDDFEHFGLHISPDLDTLMYTLAGLSNPETGWGRSNETWTFMAAMQALGAESWFKLGDGDLATHITRTQRLRAGYSLTEVSDYLCRCLGVPARLLPMSDDPVRTLVETARGTLPFQHYFVRERCQPEVAGFYFQGSETARANPRFLAALAAADLAAVIICPSNPFISIDPVLSLGGVRQALQNCPAPIIAVSPIIAGAAVKGPTAKMMAELGMAATAAAVAGHYATLLDGFVLDRRDADQVREINQAVTVTDTLMDSIEDKARLAREVLGFAQVLTT